MQKPARASKIDGRAAAHLRKSEALLVRFRASVLQMMSERCCRTSIHVHARVNRTLVGLFIFILAVQMMSARRVIVVRIIILSPLLQIIIHSNVDLG